MRELTRQGRLASAQNEYALQKEHEKDLQAQKEKALTHQERLYGIASSIRGADTNKAINTMAPHMALAEFQANNNNALNFYNADVNRLKGQYDMDLGAYKSRPPSFGQNLMTLGGMGLTGMLSAPRSSVLGGWGSKLFGGFQ